MSTAVQTIRLEHFNISSVLFCLRYLLEQVEKGLWTPDFELFAAILDYMERFPDALHHPKEEDYLFVALKRRKPDIAGVLAKVHDEHVEGGRKLKELRALLQRFQADSKAFSPFKEARPICMSVSYMRDLQGSGRGLHRLRAPPHGA